MTTEKPYRVLARKYRPQRFAELIGQDAMVRTLGNAIKRDRIAHAFLMTGVRGVGKTSTARLIAKALNCIGPDGEGGPTIDPCGTCEPCVAIAEGRHVDVIEIDAASHNGVNDVREMTEAVRYSSVSARYKIYIIDEVHMMSKQAFNALLKTLEEPPPHVKFLMATTEIDKVPVTVLSRCQRFDLRRIPAELLATHFARVADAEAITVERSALQMIARASEGSVRDGLSILDQAIAHAEIDGNGAVTAVAVRDMLGLADRGALRTLLGLMLDGDARGSLRAIGEQVDMGVDPAAVLRGLLEIVHATTLVKAGAEPDLSQSVEEREATGRWADTMSYAVLHRLWQLLLKGHDEVARATDPREAADMAVLRVIHAGQMPDPAELARRLADGGVAVATTAAAPATPAGPADFRALVAAVEGAGQLQLAHMLREQVRVISYAPPNLIIAGPADLARLKELRDATGKPWTVTIGDGIAAPTLAEQDATAESAAHDALLAEPVVAATLAAFPGAQISTRSTMQ